jgi:hypothetical protein
MIKEGSARRNHTRHKSAQMVSEYIREDERPSDGLRRVPAVHPQLISRSRMASATVCVRLRVPSFACAFLK